MASSSSTSNPPKETVYDVFMSFRGEDTRSGFSSYLYDALIQQGYRTFFDDENLPRGKAISKGLLKAIEDSRSSIVILSENYAFSCWCLRELAEIVDCMENKGQIVLPIFYLVDPSHVRNQSESYRKAFEEHERNSELNPMEVDSWKKALNGVANLRGWTLKKSDVEAKFIKDFIAKTSSILESKKVRHLLVASPSAIARVKTQIMSGNMGPNVFGKAITDSTIRTMPEYIGKEINASKRSHVALKLINADNKLVNARTFLENLKRTYGNGVSTVCLIYNATGGTVENAGNINWFGQMVGKSPYPDKIENGQWVAFLHVHDSDAAARSIAATVYRGRNANGTVCEWMLSWYNSWDDQRMYTEIREDGHYARDYWNYIYNLLKNGELNSTDTWNGCVSSVTATGDGTSLTFEGVMKLVNA